MFKASYSGMEWTALRAILKDNMRRILAIFAVASFVVETAEGRIGETEAQIRARHGEAITVARPQQGIGLTKCYSSNPFLISVTFLNGRSVREMIVKTDKSKMVDGEIQNLLQSNASDSPERGQRMVGPKIITAGVQEWRSVDQPARVAFYDSQTRALFITTQKFIDLTNAAKRQIVVRSGTGLGAREQPHTGVKEFQKGSAMTTMRRGQAQPSSSPASK